MQPFPIDIAIRDPKLLKDEERLDPELVKLTEDSFLIRFKEAACCIAEWDATPAAKQTVQYQGFELLRPMRQRIDFKIRTGTPADADKIKVIQYVNARVTDANGATVAISRQPRGTPWQWAAGADGFKVDSKDTVRCWPDRAANTPYGVSRDATTGRVVWYDNPGVSATNLDDALKNGRADPATFPWTFTGSFKTDVICTDVNICQAESPRVRTLLANVIPGSVVATVNWTVTWKVHAVPAAQGMVSVMLARDYQMNVQPEHIVRPCGGGGGQ